AFEENVVPATEFKTGGIFLAGVSDAAKGSVVYFHLINETSYQLLATLSIQKDNLVKGSFAGIIAPKSTAKVYSASLTELSNWPKFIIKSLFYSGMEAIEKQPLEYDIKFSAKNFAGAKK